ncbi:MAG TPA: hypothetical protein VNN77_02080 [candidate division Zixibacteria bacterium]|nr:hypothetical protein [candidate division Zixibacteria bacterium]
MFLSPLRKRLFSRSMLHDSLDTGLPIQTPDRVALEKFLSVPTI